MASPDRASPPFRRPGPAAGAAAAGRPRGRRSWSRVEALEGRQLLAASLVSVNSAGTASANDDSSDPDISGNGRFVVFTSRATDLVSNDNNTTLDIYIRDLETGLTQLVSVAGTGATAGTGPGNGDSTDPVVSDDGRYVAFVSAAGNLVAGDTNSRSDVFVRDVFTNTTRLVSVAAGSTTAPSNNGGLSPSISDDGRFVAFASDSSNLTSTDPNTTRDVFVRDLTLNTTTLISRTATNTPGDAASSNPSVSGDGRYVVFVSLATNLASGGGAAGADVFRRDTLQGNTRLLSTKQGNVGGGGVDLTTSPSVSDDGRFVAFLSTAGDLAPSAVDTNGVNDVFRKDAISGDVDLVSQSTAGVLANGASARAKISADGRYVAFGSVASNLAAPDSGAGEDVFLRDVQAGVTTLVSVSRGGNGGTGSSQAAMTDDARLVAFSSESRLLVGETTEDRNVFVATTAVADRTAPTFRVPPQPVDNVSGSPVVRFTVIYEDNDAIDTATINQRDLVVTGPNGFREDAALFSLVSTIGTSVTATYTVPATGGVLTPLANGTYTVALRANQVADRSRNFLAGTATVGTIVLDLPESETEAPTATFSGGSPNVGTATYEFSVIYSDRGRLNATTFDNADVIVSGPNGFTQVATALTNTVLNETQTAVVYRINAPGGVWDGPDAGVYIVSMLPGAVADVAGNTVAQGEIGRFLALGPDLVAIPLRNLRSGAISGVDQQKARVRILNNGSSPATGPIAVTLYTSTDQLLDNADATIGTFTQDLVIPANAFKQINVRFTYPQVQEGNYFVIAQVDSGNVIVEQSESNNTAASFNRVGLSAPFIDLVPTLAPFTGIRSRLGTNTATITIRNAGNMPVNADIDVALTGIRDVTPEPAEEPVAIVPLRVNLRPGQRKTFRLNFGFPIELERGTYRLVATLDSGSDVAERDEVNNRVVAFSSFEFA